MLYMLLALLAGIWALRFANQKARWVRAQDPGTEKMREIARAIQEGAMAFLSREYRVLGIFVGVVAALLFVSGLLSPESSFLVALSFVAGAGCSALAGYIGMRVATEANVRTTNAARTSLVAALQVAFSGGTVMGMVVAGLGICGLTVLFFVYTVLFGDESMQALHTVMNVLTGFSLGASSIALFARVGGGIYTKAADVGAALVGKVEAGIPEDDPRNPAVIADLVGDNVGDCAGMAADIFESYEVTIVSGLILGLSLVALTGDLKWIVYPLIIRAVGVISSIIGTFTVPIWEKVELPLIGRAHDAEEAMFRSYEVSSVFTILISIFLAVYYAGDWRLAALTAIGVGLAVAFNPLTSYFTSTKKAPVKEIVASTKTGPATTILSGLSVGMESSVWALVVIAVSFIAGILLYSGDGPQYILYAIAMVGIGMLSHTGNNVAMDSYGPISDNANGIGEMSWHGMEDENTLAARQIMADLDAVGNTTKAITKGVAIASAVIAAVSLFASYITDVGRVQNQLGMELMQSIRVSDTRVFVGLLLGGALPWLFSSLSIRAVSRAAGQIVEEVRRQFKIPGIMEGTKDPDYARVVGISTASAQKELIPLATISVMLPLLVGLVLQVEALGGFLAGIILSGQLLAVFLSNAGGAWDNAKKSIEDEPRDLKNNTGKGSERHKAGVVGDTVGDPMKDTAGPALNPMIKVANLVSLLAAPIIVKYPLTKADGSVDIVVVIVAIGLLAATIWAIGRSKSPVKELE
jgi:K(+)-stimulated pyrophosphate-energized sodium pump